MNPVRVVLVTAPNTDVARKIARALVEERLAACVNVMSPMNSIYRWQGAIEEASEVQLVIKTVQERVPTLVARVAELHPHKVPEALVLPVEAGLPGYLAWVVEETARVTL